MKPTVLIADGDTELCEIYQSFLTERGYEVEIAQNGLDCLMKLRAARPTLLVLEQELHWGGGDGVLAWLREQDGASELPVVLITTGGTSAPGAPDLRPPVVKFLPKPFSLTDLLHSVRTAVAKRKDEEPHNVDYDAPCSEFFIG